MSLLQKKFSRKSGSIDHWRVVHASALSSHFFEKTCFEVVTNQKLPLSKIGATMDQTCFVGDDLGDLPIMQFAGHAIAVGNAVPEVKEVADFITTNRGGHGAVREAIEYLMRASGTWEIAVEQSKSEPVRQ